MKGQKVRGASQGAAVDSPNGVVTPPHKPEPAAASRAPSAWASWRLTVLPAALIVLAALAAYCNSFGGAFSYDDLTAIVENQTIRQLWPVSKVLSPPTTGVTVTGRPLLNLSLAINYAISGLSVWSYHVANLAIHIAAALLLFGILRRTFLTLTLRDRFGSVAVPLALASTLIWTVHPLQTESVTYIVQRAESLMGFFYLLTLYCVIRGAGARIAPSYAPHPSSRRAMPAGGTDSSAIGVPQAQEVFRRPLAAGAAQIAELSELPSPLIPRLWYAGAVVACLLGMATKEVMLTAPLIVLLYDRTFLAGSFAEAWRRRWGLYVSLAATWGLLVYLVLSTGLIFRQSEIGAPSALGYARSQPGVILHYLRLCVWPSPLCLDYMWPVANSLSEILPGVAVVGLILTVTVWGLVRRRAYGFLGAWFLLILAPTSSVLPLNQLALEHRMYLPLAAVVVLAAAGGRALWEGLPQRLPRWAYPAVKVRWVAPAVALTAVLAALTCATAARNFDYRSGLTIWEDTLKNRPNNTLAEYNLAQVLATLGRTDEAMAHYRRVLRLKPEHWKAHNNLGSMLALSGKFKEAVEHLEQAVRLKPDFAEAHNNLANALAGLGRTAEAMEQYQEALRLNPDYANAYYNLGNLLSDMGRGDQAAERYRQALRSKPDYLEAQNSLGTLLVRTGNASEAIQHFNRALQLHPERVEIRHNLAVVLARLGRNDEAVDHFHVVLRQKPDFTEAHRYLGKILVETGRVREAIENYDRLLIQAPDSPDALNNLAWLLATSEPAEGGDPTRAVQLAQRARELGGQENAQCLDTLAAAYAAAGRFDDAVITAERAVQLAESGEQTALAKNIQSRLELYRAGRPYRQLHHSPAADGP